MQSAWLVASVLLGVLVGAAVPVLLQLRATMRSAEKALVEGVPRLETALDRLASAATELADLAEGMRSTIRVAGAIGAAAGPALTAAVKAFRDARDKGEDDGESRSQDGSRA